MSGNTISNNGGATHNRGIQVSESDSNTFVGNAISDASATTLNYAIIITSTASDTNYLADNTLGGGSINDAGTGTVYGGQVNSSGNYVIQPAGTIELMKNTTIQGGTATLGTASVAGNLVISDGSSNTATITVGSLGGNYTYSIPVTTANDTFCLVTLANCGGGSGVTTVGTYSTTNTAADGATISGSTITFQDASATAPGMMGTGTQTFAGNKTFNGTLSVNDVSLAAGKSVTITGGNTASRPASPTEGMIFYDTTTKQLLTYANGKWQADRSDAVLVAASNSSDADKAAADYVADGNTAGAADGDQVQINSALTAGSGKKVVLLAGTYVADATILVPNNTTLAGVGQGTVIQLADLDASDNLIENSDTSTGTGVTVQDMKLDGRSDLNTAGTQYGIYLDGIGSNASGSKRMGATIRNLTVSRMRSEGILVLSSDNNTLDTLKVSENLGAGINISTSSDSNTLTNNIAEFNSDGIRLSGSANTLSGNVSMSNTYFGITLTAATNSTVIGNTVSGNGDRGINLNSSSNNTLAGNNIVNTGGATTNNAIYLSASDSNTITGNAITDSSATTNNYAINIFNSTSDTNYLADNTLGGGSINDSGTGTIYASQVDASGNLRLQPAGTVELQKNTNVTGTLQATGNITASSGTVTIGTTSVAGNLVLSDGSSNTATIKVGSLAGNYEYSIPVTTANDTFCLVTLANCGGGSGVTTVGTYSTTNTAADGATISGSSIIFQDASATAPGMMGTGTQTFAGNKTFNGALTVNDVSVSAGKSVTIAGGNTASRPASPTEGMIYYDTTTKQLLTYANGKWQADRTDAVIVAASNSSQADKDAADYVADGNGGSANDGDQVQINSALTAGSGKKVILLAGTYVADATILIPNNTTLAGVGRGTLVELADLDADENLIENSDTTTGTSVMIQDISIEGRNDLNTAGDQSGIYMVGMGSGSGASAVPGTKIDRVFVSDFRNNGIWLFSGAGSTVSNSTAQGNTNGVGAGSGIRISSGSSYNTVTGNITSGNYLYGLLIAGSYNTITGNIAQGTISSTTYGILTAASTVYNTVTGNTAQGNAGFGIGSSGSYSTVSGNTVAENATGGIKLITGSNNVVSGNKIHDNGGSTLNDGIYVSNSDSSTITGNAISDTSATTNNYAINIFNSTSDTNYLADNTLGGGSINDAGTGTVYASQVDSSGNLRLQPAGTVELLKNTNVTGTLQVSGNVTASSGSVTVGTTGVAGNVVISDGSSNTATIAVGSLGGNYTYSIPVTTGNDTFCLVTLANCDGATPTAQATYTASTGGTTPEVKVDSTRGAFDIQDADTTVAGSLFTVRGSNGSGLGAALFDVTSTGAITAQNTTDSAAAFVVKEDGGSEMFSIDTTNSRVYIGDTTADATGVVLVLDTKNDASDPTGVVGAMYYNSAWGRFRCYENGAWQNCGTATRVNVSTATQAMSAGSDTYITGSQVPLPTGGFQSPTGSSQNGTLITWKITMSKTNAGTAASTFTLRIGTNGTTADTARCTNFSTGTGTAAVDWAEVTITAYATAGGATTALNCSGTLTHRLATTGFSTAMGVQAYSTAASFDSSAANTKAGLSFTGGTSSVITIQKVEVTATNL